MFQPTVNTQTDRANECPECGSATAEDPHTGETYCGECGLVVSSTSVDTGPTYEFDAETGARRRTDGPTRSELRHDRNLGSEMGYSPQEAFGKTGSRAVRERIYRMRRFHNSSRFRSKRESNLASGFTEIKRIGSALGCPRAVQETAAVLFRRASDEDFLPGRSIEAVASASVFAAARLNSTPRMMSEVEAVSQVPEQDIYTAYKMLNREFELPIPLRHPRDYLDLFASELDLSPRERHLARAYLDGLDEMYLSTGDPRGITAAAIYVALKWAPTKRRLGQERIAAVADVSPPTLRSHLDTLEAIELEEFPTFHLDAFERFIEEFDIDDTDRRSIENLLASFDVGFLFGKDPNAVTGAAVRLVLGNGRRCRLSHKTIAEALDTTPNRIVSCFRELRCWVVASDVADNVDIDRPSTLPEFVDALGHALDLPIPLVDRTIELVNALDDDYIGQKSLAGIAGAALYVVTKHGTRNCDLTMNDIATLIDRSQSLIAQRSSYLERCVYPRVFSAT